MWSRKREDDLDRELRAHLDLEAEESNDRDAARRALGNVARIKEDVREAWGWAWLEWCAQDFRYALRQMRRSPGFTLIAILTLALGLGATTAIFSIVNGVLLEPLKYREPARLFLARTQPPVNLPVKQTFTVNAAQFDHWRKFCRGCEQTAAFRFLELTLTGAGQPERVSGLSVSEEFFRTLGVQPALGRDFLPSDGGFGDGHEAKVLLADALWRSRFVADPSILGRAIQLNGEPHIVIGVLPADLHLPKTDEWGEYVGPAEQPLIFRQIDLAAYRARPVGNLNFSALIRLRPGVSREQGIAEVNGLLADIYRQYDLDTRITLIPLQQQITRGARSGLWLLLGAVSVVLMIVCVNVGNLILVRTSGRQREAGVRLALGSGRGRLFALVLEEAILLVAIGGVLGVALAEWSLRAFLAAAPANLPRIDEVAIDWRVLLFSAAAVIAATLISGTIPAWRLSRTEPIDSLKSASAASTETRGKLRVREWLVGVEVALSTVLLIVSGLLMLSFFHVLRVETGIRAENVITQDVSFVNPKYAQGHRRAFVEETVAQLAQIPGVEAAAATNHLPLLGEDWVSSLEDPDQPRRTIEQSALANFRFVTPDYFRAMGIPLRRGRYLEEADRGQLKTVVTEDSARFLWPNENPIGKHVVGEGQDDPKLEVVGVVGQIREAGLEHPFTMVVYEHYWRMQPVSMSFVARARSDPGSIATAMRDVLAHADPEMALPPAKKMTQIVDEGVATRKFQMYVAVSFAGAALLLASLGIYGVISFTVARRTPEIGIRIALGAGRAEVLATVLKNGMIPVIGGLVAGVASAILLGRFISSQLYGVIPGDPATICAVAAVLLLVALCACWLPARRATRIDPLTALRFE